MPLAEDACGRRVATGLLFIYVVSLFHEGFDAACKDALAVGRDENFNIGEENEAV